MIALLLGDDQVSSQRHCVYAEDNASSDKERRGREIGMGFGKPCLFILSCVFTVEWECEESHDSTHGKGRLGGHVAGG